jgi:Rrf2 family protein
MQVTRQADYAVRAVLYLAQLAPGQRVSTAEVSRAQHIPLNFLAKIVAQLGAAGVLRTLRGARGGISLARPAETVSLLEVLGVVDGPLALNVCVFSQEACDLALTCPVRTVWCEAQADLARRLAQFNFGQLARQAEHPSPPAVTPRRL